MRQFDGSIVIIVAALAFATRDAAAREYPPLTEAQRAELATARDGGDHRESAFAVLLANAREYDGDVGDAAIRLRPDLDAMVARAADYRGDVCQVTGVIQQMAALGADAPGAMEWFLRDDAGTPFIVYVAPVTGSRQPRVGFHDGQRVEIVARFYKRIDAAARDGQVRSYAAFVGARPRLIVPGSAAGTGVGFLWVVAIPVVVLFGVFLILVAYARRHREPAVRARRRAAEGPPALDEPGPLPDDPADALAALRHQADDELDTRNDDSA